MVKTDSSLFCSPTGFNQVRGSDSFGQGKFGASRGTRLHNGVDFNVEAGGEVYSPVFGKVIRLAIPYKSDDRFKGLIIEGVGRYAGYTVKLFYLTPKEGIIGKTVLQGEVIGTAQDLTVKYSGITNHIHFEITLHGTQIDPSRFLEKEESCRL